MAQKSLTILKTEEHMFLLEAVRRAPVSYCTTAASDLQKIEPLSLLGIKLQSLYTQNTEVLMLKFHPSKP